MKKVIILILVCALALAVLPSCKKKVRTIPQPTPQADEQPGATRVDESLRAPQPVLSEEEVFLSKSLDQVNQERPLAAIFFDFDEYNLREDAKPVLEQNASWLKKFKTAKVLIEGHCDERGTEDYNLALGEKRAKSAYDFLSSLGVEPSRIKIISYGKSQPLDPGHDESSWQMNRRAQFLVIEK
ncbi:MAG: peptidoglycan-associated lipoprotein [Candidatus Aminicenantes bacterium RBG_13_63_10]|nr:MAG: peptidoglycan-associated lipoprotein [Candidatus Aminicenantes bacterium RBG_13_63_10]